MSSPALFLDRDGVLNVDHGYVYRISDFEPVTGIFAALRPAVASGIALIVVTNQSGIARGYFTQAQYDMLEAHVFELFASQGCPLTAIYHCPHAADAGCACRKPEPGMILRAAEEHDIDLARSVMIGDKDSDMQAGRNAGVGALKIVSGQYTSCEAISDSIEAIIHLI